MIIGSRQRLDVFSNNYLDVIIGEHSIERVQNKKVLGIIIDDQLKWDRRNDEQCKTISKSIALLKRARKCVPKVVYCRNIELKVLHFKRRPKTR